MSNSNYVHVDVDEIKRETDSAFLVVVDGEEIWLPKSQISDPDSYNEGDTNCTVSVTKWIAREKGLEFND